MVICAYLSVFFFSEKVLLFLLLIGDWNLPEDGLFSKSILQHTKNQCTWPTCLKLMLRMGSAHGMNPSDLGLLGSSFD